jgi:tRNA nucleotidyltransferase (CCA-adding enzyme)
VVLRAPRGFVDEVLWPEFQELNQALRTYLNDVTLKVIREEVHNDASEAAEVAGTLPSGSSP